MAKKNASKWLLVLTRTRARAWAYTRMGARDDSPDRYLRLTKLVLGGFLLVTTLGFSLSRPQLADASTNSYINFQARLQTSSGGIVPDGTYNLEFKLYNVSTGGTALWTEDYLNSASHGVQVVDGYLSVPLGSITAFPNTINWNQQLWVTMNVGGVTSGTPTWDGEMSPRLQMTAVPYAFQAGQLQTVNGANVATLSFTAPTATDNIALPDASGTVCLQSAAACGFAPASGSGNYIQNTSSVQSGANFNISGNGTIGTNLSVTGTINTDTLTSTGLSFSGASPVIQASTSNTALTLNSNGSGTLTVDSTGTGTVNLGTGASSKAINVGTSTSAGDTIALGSSNTSTSVTLQGGADKLVINNTASAFTGNVTASGQATISGGLAENNGNFTSTATTYNLLQTNVTTLNIGAAVGVGGINLAGGSSSTGCTIDGSTGNLTCSGTITGSSGALVNYWSRSGTTLQPATSGDSITTSGNVTITGSGTLTVGTGSSALSILPGTLFGSSNSAATTLDMPGTETLGVWDNLDVANNLTVSGYVNLNNTTANVIYYGTNGVAAPGNGSLGEKIQLYGTAGAVSNTDYALGIQGSNMWFNSNGGYIFYNNSTQVASIDSSGDVTANGSVLFGGTTAVNGSASAGGASFYGRPRIGDWGQWLEVGEPAGTNGGMVLKVQGTAIYTCTSTGLTVAPTCRNTLDNGSGQATFQYGSANGTVNNPDLVVNDSGGTQSAMALENNGVIDGLFRADTSGNAVLSGAGGGGTYLAWDGGTGGIIFGNGAGGEVGHTDQYGNMAISGNFDAAQYYVGGVSGSYAMCRLGTANAYDAMVACNGAPIGDYAEEYPLASGLTYGDIVTTGTSMVNIYGTGSNGSIDWNNSIGQISQEVDSTSAYQTNIVGVVSNNYGNFTSAGYNIKSSDNPYPVALKGRVPVNIAPDSAAIAPGDYITSSGTHAGMGMKATQPGEVVGMALGSWTPGTGQTQVEVFMGPSYWPGPSAASYIQNGGNATLTGLTVGGDSSFVNLNVSGNATLANLSVTGNASIGGNLTVDGSLTVTGLTSVSDLEVSGHIVTSGTAPSITLGKGVGVNATATLSGDDTAGTITINTGSSSLVSGNLLSTLFSKAYSMPPHIVLTPASASAAGLPIYIDNSTISGSSFDLDSTVAPAANTTYVWYYHTIQ